MMLKKYAVLAALLFVSFLTIHAQDWVQIGSDIDGESVGDQFGCSVSLNRTGSIVAIGAFSNDGNGSGSGHVRVYQNNEGIWTQIGEDIDGEASEDHSGGSVSLNSDGTIVAIGASRNDGNGEKSGHVRVLKNVNGVWTQIGEDINGKAQNEFLGKSISLNSDGTIVAIGAIGDGLNGSYSGQARVYSYNNSNWIQIGNDIDGDTIDDQFGEAISLSSDGSILAIGASSNDNNGYNSGHVKIYKFVADNWTQLGTDIEGGFMLDRFGESVSLSSDGSLLAVGAPSNSGNGNISGQIKVFNYITEDWTQIGESIYGETNYQGAGSSISLSSDGSKLAFSAPGDDENGKNSGHVKFYQNNSDTWMQLYDEINGEATNDQSGRSISLNFDGSVVAIGALYNDANGVNSGHVRVFRLRTATISTQNSSSISIFPNPTTGIININLAKIPHFDKVNISITDVTGRTNKLVLVIEKQLSIDLSEYEAGIYFLQIKTDKIIFSEKIIFK